MAISVPWRRLPLSTVRLLLWGIRSVRRSPDHHPSRSSFVRYATAIGCGHQTLVASPLIRHQGDTFYTILTAD